LNRIRVVEAGGGCVGEWYFSIFQGKKSLAFVLFGTIISTN
jgi:hypothetical protein